LNELSKKGLKKIVLNERNELAGLEETDFTDSEDDLMMKTDVGVTQEISQAR